MLQGLYASGDNREACLEEAARQSRQTSAHGIAITSGVLELPYQLLVLQEKLSAKGLNLKAKHRLLILRRTLVYLGAEYRTDVSLWLLVV